MDAERKPAYWAVLPAKVRYDEGLRPNAKLLYAEITALADMYGYCWASNEYFAKLFGLATRTVSDLIGTLAKCGYIAVEVIRDEHNAVVERKIHIDKPGGNEQPPIAKNSDTPIAENCYTPIAKNGAENIINNINNIPPKAPQRGRARREPKKEPDWKPERFAAFWSSYPRGESKQAAIAAWDKLRPSDELLVIMAKALKRQMQTEQWQRGIGIPYASTWLNQRRWEEEGIKPMPSGPAGPAGGELPVWT